MRLAFYQAANAARTVDPQLAAFYRMLMVERGHCHAQAGVAVTRRRCCGHGSGAGRRRGRAGCVPVPPPVLG